MFGHEADGFLRAGRNIVNDELEEDGVEQEFSDEVRDKEEDADGVSSSVASD